MIITGMDHFQSVCKKKENGRTGKGTWKTHRGRV